MVRRTSFRFIDLFAGVGGFHHALQDLGGACTLTVEVDAECQAVYRAAFPHVPENRIYGDIRKLTRDGEEPRSAKALRALVGDHEVLCAGFPCQPFSKSGAQEGVRDRTRGTLFFEIMEIVRACRPPFVILENVRNLAGPRHRDTWRTIVESLREAGYRVSSEPVVFSPHLLPPELDGAPQVRDRVFILGEKVEDPNRESLEESPRLEHKPVDGWDPHRWQIRDFVVPDASIPNVGRYRLSPDELTWLAAWEHLVRELPDDHLPGFPIWEFEFRKRAVIADGTPEWKANFLRKNAAFYRKHYGFLREWRSRRWEPTGKRLEEFPLSRRKLEWQARQQHPNREGRTLRDLLLQFRPSGIRVKPPTYVPALVAITQTSIIGPEVSQGVEQFRRLTPIEAAALQGMPGHVFGKAGVRDSTAYRQLGNAVNVGVVKHVARALLPDDLLLEGRHPSGRATSTAAARRNVFAAESRSR